MNITEFSQNSLYLIPTGGESGEEIIQNCLDLTAKKIIYKPDAKLDAGELAYSGFMGALLGGIGSLSSLVVDTKLAKMQLDSVRAAAEAANNISSDTDARTVVEMLDALKVAADDVKKAAEAKTDITPDKKRGVADAMDFAVVEYGRIQEAVIKHSDEIVAANGGTPDAHVQSAKADAAAGNKLSGAVITRFEDAAKAAITAEGNKRSLIRDLIGMLGDTAAEVDAYPQFTAEQKTAVKASAAQLSEQIEETIAPDASKAAALEEKISENNAIVETIKKDPDAKPETVKAVEKIVADKNETLAETVKELKSLTTDAKSGTTDTKNKLTLTVSHQKHTKTGADITVMRSPKSLSDSEYKELSGKVKAAGGYWSKFAKGFILPDDAAAAKLAGDYEVSGLPAAESQTSVTSQTASSALVDTTVEHSDAENKVIGEYLNAVDNGVVAFIDSVQSSDPSAASSLSYDLGAIGTKAARGLSSLAGFSVDEYRVVIEGGAVKHIQNRHGVDGTANSSMSDVNDIARMKYVFDNADSYDYI